jgi:hypothetical protein
MPFYLPEAVEGRIKFVLHLFVYGEAEREGQSHWGLYGRATFLCLLK